MSTLTETSECPEVPGDGDKTFSKAFELKRQLDKFETQKIKGTERGSGLSTRRGYVNGYQNGEWKGWKKTTKRTANVRGNREQ